MENKKLDLNTILGFMILFGLMLYYFWVKKPNQEIVEDQNNVEQKDTNTTEEFSSSADKVISESIVINDSLANIELQKKYGYFVYSASNQDKYKDVEISTNLLDVKFSKKGGYIKELIVKDSEGEKFVDFNGNPISLIKDNNSDFNISFSTTDNRSFKTKDLFFEPNVSKTDNGILVSLKAKVSDNEYLEYLYTFKNSDYMLDFVVKSKGLDHVFNTSNSAKLNWNLKSYRYAKSVSYENRYTELVYEYNGGDDNYLSQSESSDKEAEDVTYLAFKQHFFTSILLNNNSFKTASLKSENLVVKLDDEDKAVYTKAFTSEMPLEFKNGALNESFSFYFGPADYKILNAYNKNLDEVLPLGWGIFGVINRYVFIPLFGFLSSMLPYGFAIIFMTVLVRLVMSPVTYKSYVSQAKMKVIKPELAEIAEKYKDNAMKKQKETMALQSKAGVSPLKGCLPALLQLPVFYALFQFFPSVFDLRQKSFLWAEDLSSYDTIYELPFKIPFYGDHVSLFPLLASIAIFIYMQMTSAQNMANQPAPQEGMPDMSKMMKYMLYVSPLMMLFFFNNYASGLSLYYFVSNTITIGIMLVIKYFIVDEDKIHAKIQENKKKPKKQNRLQKKMQQIMEQAEQQQKLQQQRKK